MTETWRKQWMEEGCLVVPKLFSAQRASRLRTICDRILEQWRGCNPENGKPGGDANATVMRHLNHPGYFHGHPEEFSEIMKAAADDGVLKVARTILSEEPMFRCTSYFFNPQLTSLDGNWHRDSQFGTPDPEEEKRAILGSRGKDSGVQIQIALVPSEDIEYVPRSHLRWDTAEEFHIRKADGEKNNRSNGMPGAVRFKLEAGDAVMFNPMGLHRGRYHADKLRRTLMLTYTKTSKPCADYFSRQPWFLEPGHLDALDAKTRSFFSPFIEQYRDDWLKLKGELAAV